MKSSYEKKLDDARFAAEEQRAASARVETEEDPQEKETPSWKKARPAKTKR